MADGSVRFISDMIDYHLYMGLATKAGGEKGRGAVNAARLTFTGVLLAMSLWPAAAIRRWTAGWRAS